MKKILARVLWHLSWWMQRQSKRLYKLGWKMWATSNRLRLDADKPRLYIWKERLD